MGLGVFLCCSLPALLCCQPPESLRPPPNRLVHRMPRFPSRLSPLTASKPAYTCPSTHLIICPMPIISPHFMSLPPFILFLIIHPSPNSLSRTPSILLQPLQPLLAPPSTPSTRIVLPAVTLLSLATGPTALDNLATMRTHLQLSTKKPMSTSPGSRFFYLSLSLTHSLSLEISCFSCRVKAVRQYGSQAMGETFPVRSTISPLVNQSTLLVGSTIPPSHLEGLLCTQ